MFRSPVPSYFVDKSIAMVARCRMLEISFSFFVVDFAYDVLTRRHDLSYAITNPKGIPTECPSG